MYFQFDHSKACGKSQTRQIQKIIATAALLVVLAPNNNVEISSTNVVRETLVGK